MYNKKQPARRTAAPKTRRLTVIGKSFRRARGPYVEFPDLHLRGKWLAEAGFKVGHTVDVAYDTDLRLVITLSPEQRFDHL